MTRYLLSVFRPATDLPASGPSALGLPPLDDDLKAAGVWLFTGGLHDPDTATVVHPDGGDVRITDGPYVEAADHVDGFWIVDAPDLDAALDWGEQAALATGRPVEVRPLRG